jgi:uncharacterized protein YegP (UPF0339 family)
MYRDKNNEFRWTLIASNGRKLADSGESYKRRKGMETSVCLVLTGSALPEFLLAELSDHRTDIIIDDDTILHGKTK